MTASTSLQKSWDRVLRWWAEPISVEWLRAFQVGIGIILAFTFLLWLPHLKEFFSESGYASADYVRRTTIYSKWSLFFLIKQTWFVYWMWFLGIGSSILLIANRYPRVGAAVLYVVYVSFNARFPLVNYGGSEVLMTLLFFGVFFGYNPFIDSLARRLIQVSMGYVYLFAGFSKALYSSWRNGTELYSVLQSRFSVINIVDLHPPLWIINGLTLGTVFLELSFIFLVWNPYWRRIVVISMAGLHIGILLTMNASLFSEIMIVGLFMFLTKDDWDWIKSNLAQFKKSIKKFSAKRS